MEILENISFSVQKGKSKETVRLCTEAIESGISPETVLSEGLLPGMNVIGEKFARNEVFIPEVMIAAKAMNAGTETIKPFMNNEAFPAVGKACIGTVKGDRHDIGKNLVRMMLEGKGITVIDLGTDVAPEQFIRTAVEEGCGVICCSALLTTTMGVMADVVSCAEKAGIRDKVKIMIGGAPVSEEFCQKIGADAFTSDAATCAAKAYEFLTLSK